jgi:VanZ family protein
LLLGYMVLVTAVITLAPFRFARPAVLTLSWLVDPADVVANVLLFLPLGFLFRVSAPLSVGHVRTVVAACLVSVTFEAAQLFLPGRFSSPVDVMSNTLGAGLGSLIHARIAAHLDGRLVRGLALELPLMVVVYLLVPLLWLDGFAATHDGGRLVLSPLLGLAGAIVLTAIWRHRLGERGVLSPARLAWITAGWYMVGAAPGLIRRPLLVLGAALLVALVARLEAARPLPLVPERRFELLHGGGVSGPPQGKYGPPAGSAGWRERSLRRRARGAPRLPSRPWREHPRPPPHHRHESLWRTHLSDPARGGARGGNPARSLIECAEMLRTPP